MKGCSLGGAGKGRDELRVLSVEARSSATHNPNVPDSQSSMKLQKTVSCFDMFS